MNQVSSKELAGEEQEARTSHPANNKKKGKTDAGRETRETRHRAVDGTQNRLVRINDVTKIFTSARDDQQITALRDVSFDVVCGEFFTVIGPSGCGKSTLLSIIGGLTRATTGTVVAKGITVDRPLPRTIAFVFQDYTLFPWRSVLKNVEIGLEFQSVPKGEREERALKYLKMVRLEAFANNYPRELSGGMKQRVAVARALSLEPELLLMDEPFGALDEQTRMVLGVELSRILERAKKTIIFITHSLTEAVFLSDRIAVMSARPGQIKEIVIVNEPHPRTPSFLISDQFNNLRNHLFKLLEQEITRSML